jgi:HK97 gp10 family phage protein
MAKSAGWRGAQEARRQFARLPEVVRQQINDATDLTRKAVQAGAKARVTVRTGRLKKAIRSSMDKRRGAGKVGVTRAGFYGLFLEFGAAGRSARPFMLPALEEETPRYIARAREAGKRIEQEMAQRGVE